MLRRKNKGKGFHTMSHTGAGCGFGVVTHGGASDALTRRGMVKMMGLSPVYGGSKVGDFFKSVFSMTPIGMAANAIGSAVSGKRISGPLGMTPAGMAVNAVTGNGMQPGARMSQYVSY